MLHHNKDSTQFLIIRIAGMIVVACVITLFAGTMFFLHQEVYQTIGEVKTIVLLKSYDYAEIIDFDRFEKVTAEWERKHEKRDLSGIRDPFTAIEPAPTTKATSTAE